MNPSSRLPRAPMLTTPKIHRRPRTQEKFPKPEKHRCPPIDITNIGKDNKDSFDDVTNGRRHSVKGETNPLSPPSGVSAACAARANACSHDHDYTTSSTTSENSTVTSSIAARCKTAQPKPDAAERDDLEPGKPRGLKVVLVPTSPRDAKPIREPNSFLRRRYVRADDVRVNRRVKSRDKESNKYVFVSTNKTAEPRTNRSRPRNKKTNDVIKINNDVIKISNDVVYLNVPNPERNVKIEAPKVETQERDARDVTPSDFDVTKDDLTVAWLSLVEKINNEHRGDSDADPTANDAHCDVSNSKSLSPRPSATPCPPSANKSSQRLAESDTNPGEVNDSAYSSLSSSVGSRPRSSGGTPVFGSRTGSANRPPSGGKRGAVCSLSSSSTSSCATSSDEECAKEKEKVSDSNSRQSSGKSQRGNHRIIKTKNGKKFLRHKEAMEGHVIPTPPRKPKKDPLPMNQRALPPSFWQEPNRVNPTPYSVLPPLQPLFHHSYNSDLENRLSPTPNDAKSSDDVTEESATIRAGDTELLNQLFESVLPQNKTTGLRVKRGRPRRAPRVMPSPRLKFNDNPCIIRSVTEQLFPKLTIRPTPQIRAPSLFGEAADIDFDGFLALTGSGDVDMGDVDAATTAPSVIVTSRHSNFLLPQLSVNQDYSQMLSEVASVL